MAEFIRESDHPIVIWSNDDGNCLDIEEYDHGDVPTYMGVTPAHQDGVYYEYTFIGWSDGTKFYAPNEAFPALTDDIEYTAQYSRKKICYITWLDEDGTDLSLTECLEGETPQYDLEDPTKASDDTYAYVFSGWTPVLSPVTDDTTYTAQYTRITLKPEVFWLDWYGRVMSREVYNAYDKPVYKGETPVKPSDTNSYTFIGWRNYYDSTAPTYLIGEELPALTSDVFYQAQFEGALIPTHTVTWITHEGSKDTTCQEGAVPAYGGNPADYYEDGVTCTFSGWSDGTNTYGAGEELPALGSSDITYTAQYDAVPRQNYIVTWNNYDGSEITRECVREGVIAVYPGSEPPMRAVTGQYSYTFSGWTDGTTEYAPADTLPAVTADITYTALYTEGPSHINGILPTNDENYFVLGGAWFVYNDGDQTEIRQFDDLAYGCFVEDVTDHTTYETAQGKTYHDYVGILRIAGEPVDPFSTVTPYAPSGHKELTHTVYVYGTGTYDDPYEFHMNYLYYDDLHTDIGGHNQVIEADIRDMYPGDQFRGNSRIFIGLGEVSMVSFSADPTVKDEPDNGFIGIGRNNYGYKYDNENAVPSDNGNGPYNYENGKNTICYYGLNDEGDSFLFTTEEVPVRTDFVGSNDYSDTYLVYWVDEDGYTNLAHSPEKYNLNDTPEYKGATPTKEEDDSYTYVFDCWSPEIEPVKHSYTTYTAQYIALPKPCTVTWQNYDGEVLETDHSFTDDIPYYNGDTPEKPGYSRFTYTFTGWTDEKGNFWDKDAEMPAVTGDTTYTATYTETSLLFAKHSLTLNGDIGVNFYLDVTPEEITTGSGVVVSFSWNVKGNVKKSSYKLNTNEFTEKDGKTYYKATCWVAAAEMNYAIHATAKINGVLQDETDDYRVRDYAIAIINADDNTFEKQDELTALVKAMLDYGAKAQVVFDRRDVPLANTDVDYTMGSVDASTISSAERDMETGLDDFGLEYYTNSVVFLTKNSLRLYYKITDKDKFDAVKNNITFDGQKVGYTTKGSYIYFELSEIVASELDAEHTLTIGGVDYTYSVMDYARDLVESGVDAYADLGRAIYYYNQAADAYFPEQG